MALKLSTKIVLCFSCIGLLFIGSSWLNYESRLKVISGLDTINESSTPIVKLSSNVTESVTSAEILLLKLLNTTTPAEHSELLSHINQNKSKALTTLAELKAAASGVDRNLQDEILPDIDSLDLAITQMFELTGKIEKHQHSFIDLSIQAKSISDELTQLRDEVLPLLANILLQVEEDNVISVINETNASISSGMLVIEQLVNTRNISELKSNQEHFVDWQNMHSNLLPKLIFSSNEDYFKNFVSELSLLTLSILDAVEGDTGLLAIQNERLALAEQSRIDTLELEKKIREAETATQGLLDTAFRINTNLSVSLGKDAVDQNRNNVMIGIIILSMILILSIWISRFLKTSIRQLMKELNDLSQGYLNRVQATNKTDEFGELNRYMVMVVNNLRQTVLNIDDSSRFVEKSVSSVVESSQSTLEIVQQQKSEIDLVSAALVEMSATANEVATHTEKTHREVLSAAELAKEGRTCVQASYQSIEKISEQTGQAIEVIKNLDSSVTSIEDIIGAITDIADQTNLLALNAAIEAARAGEQGRGFAVVADEVRTLATKTQESTLEIQEKISSMVADSKRAVDVMNQSEEKVTLSLEQARISDDTIAQFEEKMNEVRELSYLIATAAEEQAQTTAELEGNLTRISNLTDETNQKAESAKDVAVSQVKVVNSLKENVSKFVIDEV
ncbi:MAG: methyl-accepting chemotaxis protein [Marinomonas sp.]